MGHLIWRVWFYEIAGYPLWGWLAAALIIGGMISIVIFESPLTCQADIWEDCP